MRARVRVRVCVCVFLSLSHSFPRVSVSSAPVALSINPRTRQPQPSYTPLWLPHAVPLSPAFPSEKEMKTEGVPAELITYNAALGACDKGGEWGATVSVLNDMKAADIQPDVISYSAAMR